MVSQCRRNSIPFAVSGALEVICCSGAGVSSNARPVSIDGSGELMPRERELMLSLPSCPAKAGHPAFQRLFNSNSDAAGILDRPVEPSDDSGIVGCLDVGTKATYALADGRAATRLNQAVMFVLAGSSGWPTVAAKARKQ